MGSDGLILYTSDGGTNWSPQTSGTANGLHAVAAWRKNRMPEPNALILAGLGMSLALGYAWR